MKVLNLQCSAQHHFEGWFSSEEDYASQLERDMLECPLCADKTVHKLPSAPRLNFGAQAPAAAAPAKTPAAASTPAPTTAPAMPAQTVATGNEVQALQAAWLHMARRIVEQTEDVGDNFAEEARKIHYGEIAERGIRGQATRDETEALIDEGIDVMALLLPEGLKGPLQ